MTPEARATCDRLAATCDPWAGDEDDAPLPCAVEGCEGGCTAGYRVDGLLVPLCDAHRSVAWLAVVIGEEAIG